MEESNKTKRGTGKGSKLLLSFVLLFVAIAVLSFAAVRAFLSSPYPAAELSRRLSAALKEEVHVSALKTSGSALYLKGLRIANPPGFPRGNLLSVDSLGIAPNWWALITGKRSFSLVEVEGARLAAQQNASGQWNFARLQRHLATQKPAPAETVVRQLMVRRASLTVNGRGVHGVSLEVFDLTSKGSRDSSVSLDFQDAWRNRYSVRGYLRAGAAAAVDLSLSAAPFSFDAVGSLLPPAAARGIGGATGKLALRTTYRDGVLAGSGKVDFREVRVPVAGTELPLSGSLTFAGGYRQRGDEATVQSLVLALDNLVTVRGTGSVKDLRRERKFSAELAVDEAQLGRFPFLLPQRERTRTEVTGTISGRTLRLAGTGAAGVTSASGAILLRNGSLKRDGRTIVSALDAAVDLRRGDGGVIAAGRATGGGNDSAVVQKVDARLEARLTPKLKPVSARVSLPAARVEGVDLTGTLGFAAGAAHPFSVSADLTAATLSSLNPLLAPYKVKLSSGSGTCSVTGSGRGAADFSADIESRLTDLSGVRGGEALGVERGELASRLRRKGKDLSAAGKLRLAAFSLARQKGDADFSYRLEDKVLTLENGTVRSGDRAATFARIVAPLPQQDVDGYPVSLDLKGVALRHPDGAVTGLSGTVRARYLSDQRGSWLEGGATVAAQGVSWRGKEAGAPIARLSFSRGGGKVSLAGSVLGGGVDAEVAYQPALPEQGEFEVRVAGANLQLLSELLPGGKGKGPSVTHGVADLQVDGSYSRGARLNCRFRTTGKGIAVKGGNARTLLTDGGFDVTGAFAGDKLSIAKAELTAGSAARLRLQGEVDHPFAAQRKGRFTFSLPKTQLNDLVDPFVNVLPRLVQEAETAGGVAAEGSVALHDGKELLEGAILLDDLRLEVPSQKVHLTGIKGTIPVSLDLSGKETGKPGGGLDVSRENYPKLLQQLQQVSAQGAVLSIGKVSYGTLELGAVKMELHAEKGVTEIRSLRTALYDGLVLGKGVVSMKKGGTFRVDLLANGVSLKKLCDALPNFEGYISGKLDGFVSLTGTGSGLKGLIGFTSLWARQGKGEKMLVSKEFLQRLSKRKLAGFFFSADRPYDRAEIRAVLQGGDLTFEALDLQNTNFLGVRDLSVKIAPSQNRIGIDHLLASIRQAATRGKAATGAPAGEAPAVQPEFKWSE